MPTAGGKTPRTRSRDLEAAAKAARSAAPLPPARESQGPPPYRMEVRSGAPRGGRSSAKVPRKTFRKDVDSNQPLQFIMRRRHFLTLSAATVGGALVYTLGRRPYRVHAQSKPFRVPLRFF